jgi:hypothetical protein
LLNEFGENIAEFGGFVNRGLVPGIPAYWEFLIEGDPIDR